MADIEPEVLKEVPEDLQRLTRLITRGFYSMEHAFVMDLLVRNACVKEDDMVDVLRYDKKQLRQLINALKNDKFIKARLRVETDSEGKTTRHNYYFINYSVFVNVVKYKLDHMRKKIEMDEKNNTSRASFKCPGCHKSYTDLDTGQLLDPSTMEMLCIYCGVEVEEDMSAASRTDARTLLAKFNEQIEPIYELLRRCENLKLAPEVLEPEPVDLKKQNKDRLANRGSDRNMEMVWSGSASKGVSFGQQSTEMTISLGGEDRPTAEKVKDTPVWMKHSTVAGVPSLEAQEKEKATASLNMGVAPLPEAVHQNDIKLMLMAHEAKNADNLGGGQSDSSDSEEAAPAPVASSSGNVEEMDTDDEEDGPLVTIGEQKLAYHDVTEEMVARMTPAEKEEYIRIGQELYRSMYEY